MDVTFLGTGSAMPTGQRYQSGLLLETGDTTVLVDCGSGCLHRLQQYGPGYEAVDVLLLTHHHLDHVADVLPLLKARWLAEEPALTVAGIEGTATLLRELFEVFEYMQDRLELTIRELSPGEHTVAGLPVAATKTDHSVPALAYRFGDAVGISGDGRATPELAAFFDGVSVLAHDCSFPDGMASDNHPTPTEIAHAFETAAASVDHLYLTHLYPHTAGHHDRMIEQIAGRIPAAVDVATDGLTVSAPSLQ